jgi:hypothetical protein
MMTLRLESSPSSRENSILLGPFDRVTPYHPRLFFHKILWRVQLLLCNDRDMAGYLTSVSRQWFPQQYNNFVLSVGSAEML